MSEQAPKVDQDLLNSRSPDGTKLRIEDEEKAHVMAIASNYEETTAAGLRYAGNQALVNVTDTDEFGPTVKGILSKDMPERFNGTKDLADIDEHDDLTVEDLVEEIDYQQQKANKLADFTGDVYDKLKSTKR